MIEPDYKTALALLDELQTLRNQRAYALGYVRGLWKEADKMTVSAAKWGRVSAVRYWEHKREAYADVWQMLDPADFAAHLQQALTGEEGA